VCPTIQVSDHCAVSVLSCKLHLHIGLFSLRTLIVILMRSNQWGDHEQQPQLASAQRAQA
ncbi:MAG: hypothetical protein AAFY05_25640, partial [Pseudomonadota bacterium]